MSTTSQPNHGADASRTRVLVTYKKKSKDGAASRNVVSSTRVFDSLSVSLSKDVNNLNNAKVGKALVESTEEWEVRRVDAQLQLQQHQQQPEPAASQPQSLNVSPSKPRRINRMKVSSESSAGRDALLASAAPIPFKKQQEELELSRPIKKSRKLPPREENSLASVSDFSKPLNPSSSTAVVFSTSTLSATTTTTLSSLSSSSSSTAASAAVSLTYGRSRSFLQSSDEDVDGTRRGTSAAGGCAGRVGNSSEGIDEGLSSDDDEKKKELRGVHELRESGKATRFSDEIEYITSGLRIDNPIGMRRSSYLELATKCLDSQFLLKARAHNVLVSFCDGLAVGDSVGESDQIISSISLFILFIMCQDRRNVDILVDHPTVIPLILKQLVTKPDILLTPPRGKYEKGFVIDFKKLIDSSRLLLPTDAVSNYVIGIQCLEVFVAATTSARCVERLVVRDSQVVRMVLGDLKEGCWKACPPIACVSVGKGSVETGLQVSQAAGRRIKMYIKILQRMFGDPATEEIVREVGWVWEVGLDVLGYTYRVLVGSNGGVSAFELVFLTLQFLIDASAEDPLVCKSIVDAGGSILISTIVLSSWKFLDKAVGADNKSMDNPDLYAIPLFREHCGVLLSALAVLANLVRNDDGLKKIFIGIEISLSCPSYREKSCECKKPYLVLAEILKLFRDSVKNDVSHIPKTANVIICAIIGCLVSSSLPTRDVSKNAKFIHKITDASISFEEMANLVEDFAKFHKDDGQDVGESAMIVDGGSGAGVAVDAGILKQMDRLLKISGDLRR
ncbi:UNVERIFIED_CONTAM: hypothetical protein HDU68_001296 [Siphonaria sp. JEL0065]|nr:hypothetical protein HDU68_001296 [Siphonaria sp. JEL0065]